MSETFDEKDFPFVVDPKVINLAELRLCLRLDGDNLVDLMEEGLPFLVLPGGSMRFIWPDVVDWLKARQTILDRQTYRELAERLEQEGITLGEVAGKGWEIHVKRGDQRETLVSGLHSSRYALNYARDNFLLPPRKTREPSDRCCASPEAQKLPIDEARRQNATS